jgi:hypothetical protein
MSLTTEDELVENDKTVHISQSVIVAALLLIEWMQMNNQKKEADMLVSQQASVCDQHPDRGCNSR